MRRSKTNAAESRLAGTLIRTLLLAILLAALQANAAAGSEPVATSSTAGLLALGAGYDQPHGSDRVRALQNRLRTAGESPGPVDGRFGPQTDAAVRLLQAREGLAVDGVVGPHTQTALRRSTALVRFGMGYGDGQGRSRVRELQRQLRLAGEHPGPIDGRLGPLTERAVRHFQNREGLAVDGIVGKATHTALASRLASVRNRAAGTRPGQGGNGKRSTNAAPQASTPSAQGKPAPVGNSSSGSDRSGLRTAATAALGLAGALALLSTLLVLRSRTHRRLKREPAADTRTREKRVSVREGPITGGKPVEPPPAANPVAAPDRSAAKAVPVIGYASIHAAAGVRLNSGQLREQAERIAAECGRRELSLIELVREREPQPGGGVERPGLAYAIERISAGDAQGLVVAELPRLARSVPELGRILEWFSSSGARLVVARQRIDTAERGGLLVVRALIAISRSERERLVEGTREGMRATRRKGPAGVADNPELDLRIRTMRAEGLTLEAIADRLLNADRVATVRGGAEWRPSGPGDGGRQAAARRGTARNHRRDERR
jgi:peptidoglycan hydrolase-like protein with peptidoglycan-binding domain/DNA invertase Pin-like site-specific DNA recombinase